MRIHNPTLSTPAMWFIWQENNFIPALPSRQVIYDMKAFTEPLTRALHIGHFFIAGAHSAHVTRCPHGRNTMETGLSRHTLQMVCSFSFLFSAFILLVSFALDFPAPVTNKVECIDLKQNHKYGVSEFSLGFWKLEFKNPLLWKVGVQTEKLEFAPKTMEFRTASC